jgi:hypothetical protein
MAHAAEAGLSRTLSKPSNSSLRNDDGAPSTWNRTPSSVDALRRSMPTQMPLGQSVILVPFTRLILPFFMQRWIETESPAWV